MRSDLSQPLFQGARCCHTPLLPGMCRQAGKRSPVVLAFPITCSDSRVTTPSCYCSCASA